MKSADGLLRVITCNNRARRQSIALALNVLGLIPPFSVTDGTEKERCLCRAMTIRKCFSWSLMSLDCDNKKHGTRLYTRLLDPLADSKEIGTTLGQKPHSAMTRILWERRKHHKAWLSLATLQHCRLPASQEGRAACSKCISKWEGRAVQTTLLF